MKKTNHKRMTSSTILWGVIDYARFPFAIGAIVLLCVLFCQTNNALGAEGDNSNEELLRQYVQTKGSNIISFDASNIKQFWVDKSVVSKNNTIEILMHKNGRVFESVPLKIQLVNVNGAQDCKVEVISETDNLSFSVLNSDAKGLSASRKEDVFLNYSVITSVFHLESTKDFSFLLKFNSSTEDMLSIKKIILSFSKNTKSKYLLSPGKIQITKELSNITATRSEADSAQSYLVTGKRSIIFTFNNFLSEDNTISSSVTIENTGAKPTSILVGFAVYNKEQVKLDHKNYPYNNINKVLTVISSSENNNTILVDSYTDWNKNCYLALNAMDDMSDIPNTTLVDGRITEIRKKDNGQAEIVLDKPLKEAFKQGTKLRVHGPSGAFLYTHSKVLQPGDKETFTSSIKKDNTFLRYDSEALSKGVYYVVPIILSYSTDPNEENTVRISDYTVSY